jgi:hypothetical protein
LINNKVIKFIGKLYILFNSIEFSSIKVKLLNKFISLLLMKFSIIDLSIKKEIIMKNNIKNINININLKDIENISFEDKDVT